LMPTMCWGWISTSETSGCVESSLFSRLSLLERKRLAWFAIPNGDASLRIPWPLLCNLQYRRGQHYALRLALGGEGRALGAPDARALPLLRLAAAGNQPVGQSA